MDPMTAMIITTTIPTGTHTGTAIRMTDRDDPNSPDFEFWRHRRWWRAFFIAGFGPMFFVFLTLAILAGAAVWLVEGQEVFWQALEDDLQMLMDTVPRVMAAVGAAGIMWVLLPRDKISAMVGRNNGLIGLCLATVAGTITPGGPTSAFALLAMIGAMGADRGTMVTYITAWATLGLQRILTWDIPMMGFDLSALRFVATLPLPVVAGLIARMLPIDLVLKAEIRLRDKM